jgi:hypothetical protein
MLKRVPTRQLKIIMVSLIVVGLLAVLYTPVLAVTSTYVFNPPCSGPGGATTLGLVGPGSFAVSYFGSSFWIDYFVCDDWLGCLYMVRQPLAAGHYIDVSIWSSFTNVSIWTGWCG